MHQPVTKIMSLLLIFEDLKQGKIKLTDTVTVSEHAASMAFQAFLETGEKQKGTNIDQMCCDLKCE